MVINNFIKMNDWEISKFLTVIFALQISLLGLVGLDLIGFKIPILREVVAFIYLTFVPGVLILRILRLHKLSNIETLLYTVGLSISSLMFLGFFINLLYPLFGISKPLSTNYLLITLTGFVLFLSLLSYFIDRNYSAPDFIDLYDLSSPTFLFLCLIPFLAVFGTYLMNFYNVNSIILTLIVLVSIIAVLVSFDKIPKKLEAFALFIISISLLYQGWLISMYIWGGDIYSEYYFSKLVIENSYWNWSISQNTNAMLSITILGPFFHNISDMSLTWVYKIVYPFLFSLVPLGLYHIVRKQTTDKIAFLSSFFFVSTIFYSVWVIPFKQELAELYIILLTLLIIDITMDKKKISLLLVLFGFSLVVSHYGTSYLYILSLLFVCLMLNLFSYFEKKDIFNSKFQKFLFNSSLENRTVNSSFVVLFIVFTFSWYIYTSDSSLFENILRIGHNITSNIYSEFLSSNNVEGLNYVTKAPLSIFGYIQQFLYILTSFLIVVGILSQLINRCKLRFQSEYYLFSVMALILCVASITVPYFSSAMYTQRLYQLTLVFLAPFCVIGAIQIFKVTLVSLRLSLNKRNLNNFLKFFSIFLVIFLIFNIGFVDEVASTHRLDTISFSHNVNIHKNVYEQDVYATQWFSHNYNTGLIYADITTENALLSYGGFDITKLSPTDQNINLKEGYLYLGYQNIVNNLFINTTFKKCNLTEISQVMGSNNQIYSNGGTKIIISND